MEDKEIIKALEHCSADDSWCDDCPYENLCTDTDITKFALDFINRLIDKNKAYKHYYDECLKDLKKANAEIERLTGARNTDPMDFCGVLCRYAEELINKAKAEAVKEFAERLKETGARNNAGLIIFVESNIDNLVKEMVGEG